MFYSSLCLVPSKKYLSKDCFKHMVYNKKVDKPFLISTFICYLNKKLLLAIDYQ